MKHRKKQILVDGYNFIKCVPMFNGNIEYSLQYARSQLESILLEYSKCNDLIITIYYDGNRDNNQARNYKNENLIIFFSMRPQIADDLIMDAISSKHGARWLSVVTSDREIQRFAKRHKVAFIDSQQFAEEIEQPTKITDEKISTPREEDPDWKPKEGEVEEWLREFEVKNEKELKIDFPDRENSPDIDTNLSLNEKEVEKWYELFKRKGKDSN